MKVLYQVFLFIVGVIFVFADSISVSSSSGLPPKPSNNDQNLSPTQKLQSPQTEVKHSGSNPLKKSLFMMSGVQRKKTVKDDHIKAKKYHTFASQHGSLSSLTTDDISTPEIESEAYFGYPMTLDYVVDVYVQSTDDTISSYSVIADTGSSNLAISVSDCENCGTGSSNLIVDYYSPEMCVEVVYGSGSWSGLMTDLTFVGMSEAELGTDIYFSAITDGDSFFVSEGFQGILGLGYSGITSDYLTCTTDKKTATATTSTIEATPYTDSLKIGGVIDENIFTMSFCGTISNIAIGGIDSSQYSGDITYVTTQKTYDEFYGYYLVEIDAISIDGVDIGDVSSMNTIGGSLVDSGTTLLYVSSSVYTSIKKAVESSVSSLSNSFFEWSSCLSEDQIDGLPTITFTIDTYDLVIEPSEYLLYYEECYYWGVSSSSVPIIGNIALQNLLVVFDKENNQIGFADAVCPSVESDKRRPKIHEEQVSQQQPQQPQQQQQIETSQFPQQQTQVPPLTLEQQLKQLEPLPHLEFIPANNPQFQTSVVVSFFGMAIVGVVIAAFTYFRNTDHQYQPIPSEIDYI